MDKISKSYKTDSADGLSAEIKSAIDKIYFPTLKHLEKQHPKLLVVFSGGNAVGKSSLSKRIQDDLGAVVLENDAMKSCIKTLYPNLEKRELNKMTWQYSMDLYSRLDDVTSNGLIVRDGVIDWYFDRILPIFFENGYKIFTIGFDVSKENNVKLIKERGDKENTSVEALLERLGEHDVHIERFRSECKPDIILNDENLFNHGEVVERIRKMLEDLSKPIK